MPKTSPSATAFKPSAGVGHRDLAVDQRPRPGDVHELDERCQLRRVPIVEPPPASAGRRCRTARPARRHPGGGPGDDDRAARLSDFTECDQVAAPTVSITASTRAGSRSPVSTTSCAPISRARARLSSSRLVANTGSRPPARSMMSARRHAPTGALHGTESPGLRPDCVKSIRYAVSHAVGRHAASANDRPRRLRDHVVSRDGDPARRTFPGSARQQRPLGVGASSPVQDGSLITAWTSTSLPSSS